MYTGGKSLTGPDWQDNTFNGEDRGKSGQGKKKDPCRTVIPARVFPGKQATVFCLLSSCPEKAYCLIDGMQDSHPCIFGSLET